MIDVYNFFFSQNLTFTIHVSKKSRHSVTLPGVIIEFVVQLFIMNFILSLKSQK